MSIYKRVQTAHSAEMSPIQLIICSSICVIVAILFIVLYFFLRLIIK